MVENDSLLREVNEAVRHDRMMAVWNQFKMPLVYAAIALIAVTAGSSIWNHYQQSQAERAAMAFDKAQQLYIAQKYDAAAKAFDELTHQTRGDLADMAKLWHARSLLGDDKKKTALRTLQNIIVAPEGRDLFWRDMACLHVMGLVKGVSEVPEACNGSKPSPLSSMLVQLNAVGVWHEGDTKTARELLSALANNPDAPLDARAQARAWETTIGAHSAKE